MSTAPVPSLALLLALALPCCGGNVFVDAEGTAEDPDASITDASDEAEADAGPVAPPQCLCPDAPGYAPCIKPMECCPTVGQCKDPASFNCSGSSLGCP